MPLTTSDATDGADGEADAYPLASRQAATQSLRRTWTRARFTIAETASGLELDSFQTEAEAVASLAFAGLYPDEVELIAVVSTMTMIAFW